MLVLRASQKSSGRSEPRRVPPQEKRQNVGIAVRLCLNALTPQVVLYGQEDLRFAVSRKSKVGGAAFVEVAGQICRKCVPCRGERIPILRVEGQPADGPRPALHHIWAVFLAASLHR